MSRLKDTELALRSLTQAVEHLADMLAGFDIGAETFEQFSCREIEALAQVLRLAGEGGTADQVIEWHAAGDDPGDDHYAGREGDCCPDPGCNGSPCTFPGYVPNN